VTAGKTHLSDEEVDVLGRVLGHRLVISISNGCVHSNRNFPKGVFFDNALIEYWPTSGRRRKPANLAIPMPGNFESRDDSIWAAFKASQPIEVFGVEEPLPDGRPWWFVPPTFDYWPPSQNAVTQVDVFEEIVGPDSDPPISCDVRLEIHFSDRDVLGLEAGVLGRGFVLVSAGARRPWETRRTLRLRKRLN
jgi:hypothetical protein